MPTLRDRSSSSFTPWRIYYKEDVAQMRVDPRLYELKNEFDKLLCPEAIREAERLHHKISKLSEDDLLKPFTV